MGLCLTPAPLLWGAPSPGGPFSGAAQTALPFPGLQVCSSNSSPKQCELPSQSLENLTVGTGAEPAAGQGAGAVPTLAVIPSPSHCGTFHTHIPTQAPLKHQLPLTPISSPSAAG